MALHHSRPYLLAFTIPAAIAVAFYIWVRRKKKRTKNCPSRDQQHTASSCSSSVSSTPRSEISTNINSVTNILTSTSLSSSHTAPVSPISVDQSPTTHFTLSDSIYELNPRDTDISCASTSSFETKTVDPVAIDDKLEAETEELTTTHLCIEDISTTSSLIMTSLTSSYVNENLSVDTIHMMTSSDADCEFSNDSSVNLDSPVNGNPAAVYVLQSSRSHFDDTTDSVSFDSTTITASTNASFTFDNSSSDISSIMDESFVKFEANLTWDGRLPAGNSTIHNVDDSELSYDSSLSVIVEEPGRLETSNNPCEVLDEGVVDAVVADDIKVSSPGGEELNAVEEDLNAVGEELNVVEEDLNVVGEELNAVEEDLNVVGEELYVVDEAQSGEISSLSDDLADKCEISSGSADEQSEVSQNESAQKSVSDELSSVVEGELSEESEVKTDIEQEPPVALSPSLSAEEPELAKLANGNETSAYGSSSQSPAEELMVESPTVNNYFADNECIHSGGSSDSGKGESDANTPNIDSQTPNAELSLAQVYEFEIPPHICGRMIGYKGQHVRNIKSQTRADITIYCHPYTSQCKICSVVGSETEIRGALDMIRKRFPLAKYPDLTLAQVNHQITAIPIPETLQLQLPQGVSCDVILSSLVNAGHFFVQQPTHPTYSSLNQLDHVMMCCYTDSSNAPSVPNPNAGVICSAQAMGGWYRAQVVYVHSETNECDIRFLDYGGYARESLSMLKQIRSDFMTLPFQASECYLSDVVPVDESGWSVEATAYFEELAQGQILQATIVSFSEEGIPYVQLFRVQGVQTTFINGEMVHSGFAKWMNQHTTRNL